MNRPLMLAPLTVVAALACSAPALAASMTYHAMLSGAQEVSPGDPDGSAMADVTVNADHSKLCYAVHDIQNIGPILAAHIHRGAAGQDGPHLIPLTLTPDGTFKGCVDAPDWLPDAMKSNFTGYYINIHTKDYPTGAIRGQLGL